MRSDIKLVLIALVIAVGLAIALILGHLAFIELCREVVTLPTTLPDGTRQETRSWIVDDGDASWLHSAGDAWLARFEGDPIVEVERRGQALRYRAHAVLGPHLRIDQLLRQKYGLADRWVRFISPCGEDTLPVRLEPLPR